ncbi:MAG: hypothetical protein AVDCRST_MAG73-1023, partial [uncultured Thermomicrobiales bacterium]
GRDQTADRRRPGTDRVGRGHGRPVRADPGRVARGGGGGGATRRDRLGVLSSRRGPRRGTRSRPNVLVGHRLRPPARSRRGRQAGHRLRPRRPVAARTRADRLHADRPRPGGRGGLYPRPAAQGGAQAGALPAGGRADDRGGRARPAHDDRPPTWFGAGAPWRARHLRRRGRAAGVPPGGGRRVPV